jgi:hypothetical protein
MSVAANPAGAAFAPDPSGAARAVPAIRRERDLRLDFFRGLSLWFIFLDHVPDNIVSWLTVRNYGFSDATEIFVFISGYTAVIAYSSIMARRGWPLAGARIVRRVWQLYVAHIMLFVAFTAQVAWVTLGTGSNSYLEELNLLGLLDEPVRAVVDVVLLKFRPVGLDVLPLYIVLLGAFPLILPIALRSPVGLIAGSLVLYIVARYLGWNLPGAPEGKPWFFNPFAWQLVFCLGASFAAMGNIGERLRPARLVLVTLAILYLLFAAFVALSWHVVALSQAVPDFVGRLIYPIDKTDFDPLRVLHFLAMAYLVQVLVPASAAFLRWPLFLPLRRCGEHSLQIFCLGTFLSFTAYVILNRYDDSIWTQIGVSLAGIAAMVMAAYAAHWYKSGETGPRAAAQSAGEIDG